MYFPQCNYKKREERERRRVKTHYSALGMWPMSYHICKRSKTKTLGFSSDLALITRSIGGCTSTVGQEIELAPNILICYSSLDNFLSCSTCCASIMSLLESVPISYKVEYPIKSLNLSTELIATWRMVNSALLRVNEGYIQINLHVD